MRLSLIARKRGLRNGSRPRFGTDKITRIQETTTASRSRPMNPNFVGPILPRAEVLSRKTGAVRPAGRRGIRVQRGQRVRHGLRNPHLPSLRTSPRPVPASAWQRWPSSSNATAAGSGSRAIRTLAPPSRSPSRMRKRVSRFRVQSRNSEGLSPNGAATICNSRNMKGRVRAHRPHPALSHRERVLNFSGLLSRFLDDLHH